MASVFTKLLLSTIGLAVLSESAMAYYNADQHEAQIRRNCSRLRDSEERWGCFSGDITMIEQIRRRERREKVYRPVVVDNDYGRTPTRPKKRYVPKPTPVVRDNHDSDNSDDGYTPAITKPAKPVVTKPAPEKQVTAKPQPEKQVTPPAPSTPQPAKPDEGEGTGPKLISQKPLEVPAGIVVVGLPEQAAKDDGDIQIKDEGAPNATSILGVPGTATKDIAPQRNSDGTLAKGDRLDVKPAPQNQREEPKAPIAKPVENPIAKNDEPAKPAILNPAKPEAEKPAVARAEPEIPTKFKRTCFSNVSEVEKKPHVAAALKRILGTNPLKRGETRDIGVSGQRLDPKQCLGLFTRTLRGCNARVEAEQMKVRATRSGQLQTFVNDSWEDTKTCTDGEKIENMLSFSKSGFTFNLTSVVSNKNGRVSSRTTGYLNNDPGHKVDFARVTLHTGSSDGGNTAFVAQRRSAVR